MDGPGTVRVTPVYGDTLTWGGYSSGYPWRVAIHGRSGVCQSNFGVRGYSDIGEYMSGNPCTTLDCQSNSGLQSGGQTRHGITGHHSSHTLLHKCNCN